MYTEILKKLIKILIKIMLKLNLNPMVMVPLNILVNIHTLVLVVRYKRVCINTCWYNEFYEKVQVRNN